MVLNTRNHILEDGCGEDDVSHHAQQVSRNAVFSYDKKGSLTLDLREEDRLYFFTGVVPYTVDILIETAKSVSEPLGRVVSQSYNDVPRYYMDKNKDVPDALRPFLSSQAKAAEDEKRHLVAGQRVFLGAAASAFGGRIENTPIALPHPHKSPGLYEEAVLRLKMLTPIQRQDVVAACQKALKAYPKIPSEGFRRTCSVVQSLRSLESPGRDTLR